MSASATRPKKKDNKLLRNISEVSEGSKKLL